MKPHMAHIQNTLIKKRLSEEAKDEKSTYAKYRELADKALANGYPKEAIIDELESEMAEIQLDVRNGDHLFQVGVSNAKQACLNAIRTVISELKGESNVIVHTES